MLQRPTSAPPKSIGPSRLRQSLLSALRRVIPARLLLVQGDPRSDEIHLTFDDGPDPVTTPQILDTLRRHQARATFFVVGERVAAHPDLVQRIDHEGHRIGGHSYWHRPHAEVSARELLQEIQAADDVLEKILGQRPRLFRPPYGKLTAAKLALLWGSRRQVVLWNRDPKDFATASATDLAQWFVERPLQGGDVVLLHDTCAVTATVLEQVLSSGVESGKKFTPLS